MIREWDSRTLDEISTNLDSRRVPITKSVRIGGTYPYYGASGIVDYVDDYIFDEETLLISEDGANLLARTTPIAFPATGKYWVNNHAHVLKFENQTVQRFVELFLASIALDDYVTGAAQPKLNQAALNSIPIPFPPLPEQQRIVAILDEAFTGIAAAKANAEKNLRNARELFESQLERTLTESEADWVHSTLGAETDLQVGFAFKSAQYVDADDGVRLLRGDNVAQGILRWNDAQKLAASEVHRYAEYLLELGDAVLAMDRPWIKAGLKRAQVSCSDLPCLLLQRVARLRRRSNLDARFLFYLIRSIDFSQYLLGQQTGIGVPHISGTQISAYQFPRPPLIRQRQIAESLDELFARVERLASIHRQKVASLDELKKSLLHQAFSGQL
jgi:type I restriction enzyme, S subunit